MGNIRLDGDEKAQTAWLEAIIESADDAIISKTLDGILTSWNKAAQHIFGYTADEAVGRSVLMLIPYELRDEEAMILGKIRSGDRIEHYETTRVAKDGRLVDVSLTVSPIKDADGKIIGASKILRDITRQKQIEEERDALLKLEQDAREQAEVASRAKDEFLGLLSHELRTPLNSILGWTRILSGHNLDEAAAAQALETIDRNAKLQARLIDDMLDVSRIISGKLRLDAQAVDLTSVINSAVETLRPAAEAKHIHMRVSLDFGTGTVLGDPMRLQQVIWNLVSNAVKFVPREGSVKVSLSRVNSHAEISVSDTGPGIENDFLPYVFDRFRQADSATNKKYAGLGLGLSIVRHLVELHGGTVEAANNADDNGAVFTVKLPVMAVSRSFEQISRRADAAAAEAHLAFDSPPDLSGVKVLAVDDEQDARLLLQAMFEQCGAQIETCASVAEALEMLNEYDPDVLVSDIGMPGEDGYTLIRKVRELEEPTGKRLPAVALTAFARTEDRVQALAAGFNMHVPKPVEPAELALVISSLVK
ncbi:MAG TPA: PAS domain S-box protein [Pyrinomonadaceae bacterium]|nr:PAS domain S-box protein [Pyrinomonadaceae bacterium]